MQFSNAASRQAIVKDIDQTCEVLAEKTCKDKTQILFNLVSAWDQCAHLNFHTQINFGESPSQVIEQIVSALEKTKDTWQASKFFNVAHDELQNHALCQAIGSIARDAVFPPVKSIPAEVLSLT